MVADVPLLELDGVTKLFGGLAAVADVSFGVHQGEILGLIGPNGSGKSTLINLISGLHRVTRGEMRLRGGKITDLPPERIARLGVARTFQLLRLFPGLSVFDNVLAGTHLRGSHGLLAALGGPPVTGREERALRARAQAALEFVGLEGRAEVRAGLLTAGEGRLLELARALASDPDLILLDEPAAGLNSAETARLEGKLRLLRERGKTLLLVDHDMSLIMSVTSKVVVLAEGRVLSAGTPEQIQSDRRVVEAYLGSGGASLRRRRREHQVHA